MGVASEFIQQDKGLGSSNEHPKDNLVEKNLLWSYVRNCQVSLALHDLKKTKKKQNKKKQNTTVFYYRTKPAQE